MVPAEATPPLLRVTHSEEETLQLGIDLAKSLPPSSVICLWGDLGAGKTVLSKGLIHGRTGTPIEEITSPTYVTLHVYGEDASVAHFDLYRLKDCDAFLAMGFEEYLTLSDLCIIEWPGCLSEILPPNAYHLQITHEAGGQRRVEGRIHC